MCSEYYVSTMYHSGDLFCLAMLSSCRQRLPSCTTEVEYTAAGVSLLMLSLLLLLLLFFLLSLLLLLVLLLL